MDVLGFYYYVKFNQCDDDTIVWLETQKKEKRVKDLNLLKPLGLPLTIIKGEFVVEIVCKEDKE